MPEDSKKNIDKKKHDPKEQRKPRQVRKSDRKPEKAEEIKSAPKVSVQQKPAYEDPGPEFYNNLKRETEEIVKITEAENAKYRKKEIQSNWAKYEMPVESYEDVDEHDIGADYEKLIQAPLSAGGHFQFKHEKSWDSSTAPSLYDKYFEINMDNLATAIQTIPFYERNRIDQSEFSEKDILSMNHRASKYKLKYFNDKTYATPETEAQEIILKSLTENVIEKIDSTENLINGEKLDDSDYEVNLDCTEKTDSITSVQSKITQVTESKSTLDDFDDEFLFRGIPDSKSREPEEFKSKDTPIKDSEVTNHELKVIEKSSKVKPKNEATQEQHVASKVNPVIESPEDLEKWLDDFLDS